MKEPLTENSANGAPRQRATLKDIAEHCGVSKITVSRALQNSDKVRPLIRERVQEAARKLGYRVNLAARDLRLSNRRRVAIVVDWTPYDQRPMLDPYPLVLLGSAVEEFAAAGYAAIVTTNAPALRAEAADTSGIILLGQGRDHSALQHYASLGIPIVVWGDDDGFERASGAIVVGSDNRQGGIQAAEYLIKRGCRHCVFVGDTHHAEMLARKTGCEKMLETHGQELSILECDLTTAAAELAAEDLLGRDRTIDGVFAGSDLMAIGVLRAAKRAGRELAIIGYDDVPAATAFGLTTISQDWIAGGRLLAETLLAIVAGQHPSPAPLATRLIVRDT